MFNAIRRLLRRTPPAPRTPIELTMLDQWVLRVLFRGDRQRYVTEETVVNSVLVERPATIPHEVRAAARKLATYGLVEQNDVAAYRASAKGRRLRDVVPAEPTVNIDIYQ